MKNKLAITVLIAFLFGCTAQKKKKHKDLIDLTNLTKTEGYTDVPLTIVGIKDVGAYFEYDTKAVLKEDTLGLLVRLKKSIPAGFVNGEPKNMFLTDGIEFVSKGAESDKLLQFLAQEYGLEDQTAVLKESQIFTCANLNDKATDYANGESGFKIFLEEEEDYAELFVKFNFTAGFISLNEKDQEYREGLIRLMKK